MIDQQINRIALDSHVHFYDCWKLSLDQLLTVTYNNISSYINSQGLLHTLPGVCLLDTAKSSIPFSQKLKTVNQTTENEWKIEDIKNEPCSFLARSQDRSLLVITGSQINTREGLEVLVIGNTDYIKDGLSINSILEQNREGMLTIIPWAVGKWLGKRGSILSKLMDTVNVNNFLLGDNAGRPWLWKNISQFNIAAHNSLPVLAGSDPLPLDKHYQKSGTYGNLIELKFDLENPLASIVEAINKKQKIETFGELSSVSSFILNQFKLRL